MPELPEVETTLRGVLPHLEGRRVKELIVQERRLRWPVPQELDQIEGQRFVGGRRRAKYLLFETDQGTLLIHLGMSGSLRLLDPAADWRKHDHLAFRLDSGKELRFHDPRRFGTVQWITQTVDDHPLLAKLGPEPLGGSFSGEHLHRLSRGKRGSVKSFIMDGHVVVGVGNIYACEALYLAGIHPTRPAGRISRARYDALAAAIREVLSKSIEMGGTTLRDFVNESGEPGYFKQTLRVYDRENEPCRDCEATVKRRVQHQRSTFFCPQCQR